MGFIEDARQLIQDLIVPELRGIKASIDELGKRLERIEAKQDKMDSKLDRLVERAETTDRIIQFEERLRTLESRVSVR